MKKRLIFMLAVTTMIVTMVPVVFAANTDQSGADGSAYIIGPDPIDASYFAKMKKYLLDGGNGYFDPAWDLNKDGVFDALDYAANKKLLLK